MGRRLATREKETNVVPLFKEKQFNYATWQDTPRQRLAVRRNWCCYMINGMLALTNHIEKFMGKEGSKAALENTRRALRSLRYSVDAAYYEKVEAIDRKEGKY